MNELGTAREALLVEALGGFGQVLDRIETLQTALFAATQALKAAEVRLDDRLAHVDQQVTKLTERAQVTAVKHILARTDDAARRSVEQQRQLLAEAARTAFSGEIGASLQSLRGMMATLLETRAHRFERWLVLAATAATSSTVTAAALLWFSGR